jgi:hypothetical protein
MKVASLSNGGKLVLAAGGLLFFDLFLTWQAVPVAFGPKNTITKGLDGWDVWGLLIGLAILALIALVVARVYDEGFAFDQRWDRVTLGLGVLVFALAVLKNFRDGDSTWASYLGVVLAGLVAAGAYLDLSMARTNVARWNHLAAARSRASAPRAADSSRTRRALAGNRSDRRERRAGYSRSADCSSTSDRSSDASSGPPTVAGTGGPSMSLISTSDSSSTGFSRRS